MAKKNLKNRIAVVLDRSTSMGIIRAEAVSMFNDQIKEIKKGAKKIEDTTVSLFTFSTTADEPVVFNRPAKELKELTLNEYAPGGWTALYDSIGMAIDRLIELPEMSDPECSFLVIVVTDGDENKSTKFNGASIADRIQLLQRTGRWTFTFCGANIDVEKMQQQLHIPKGNVSAFVSSAAGMHVNSSLNTRGLGNYFSSRAAGCKAVSSFYEDPNAATTTTTTTTTTKTPKAKVTTK